MRFIFSFFGGCRKQPLGFQIKTGPPIKAGTWAVLYRPSGSHRNRFAPFAFGESYVGESLASDGSNETCQPI